MSERAGTDALTWGIRGLVGVLLALTALGAAVAVATNAARSKPMTTNVVTSAASDLAAESGQSH